MAQLDQITEGVYRINCAGDGGFSFTQFLIKDEKNTLIHTGSVELFDQIAEKIGQVLPISELAYIFISHFEADECGALTNFLKLNTNLTPVCSASAARQLKGFGLYEKTPLVVKADDELALGKRTLRFINYPSEIHLRDGLLAYETSQKVLFSSDLFITRGQEAAVIKQPRTPEVLKISPTSILSDEGRAKCQEAIGRLDIQLVAVGHGPVLDLRP